MRIDEEAEEEDDDDDDVEDMCYCDECIMNVIIIIIIF